MARQRLTFQARAAAAENFDQTAPQTPLHKRNNPYRLDLIFQALADRHRRLMVSTLSTGPETASELAGLAAALAIFWDAFADLAIGMVSDRTRSRFGRRRPYVLGGGIALALSIVVLFRPPLLGSQAAMAASLLASFIFMNTAVSLLSVPHTALASELTTDANERTTLFGYRLFLGNLGFARGRSPARLRAHASDPR